MACGSEVDNNAAMVDAKPAISSLRELAPGLSAVKALKLAKGACTPAVTRRDDTVDLEELADDRQTDEELAEKIAVSPRALLHICISKPSNLAMNRKRRPEGRVSASVSYGVRRRCESSLAE